VHDSELFGGNYVEKEMTDVVQLQLPGTSDQSDSWLHRNVNHVSPVTSPLAYPGNSAAASRFYSVTDRGAEYCDERVCLCVCVSVCLSAIVSSEPCVSDLRQIFCACCLQCFDAVGWAAGRASGL